MRQTTRRTSGASFPVTLCLLVLLGCSAATTSPVGGEGSTLVVSPDGQSVAANGTLQFAATVAGSAIPVDWTVDEPTGCGTVSAAGLYTAPGAATTCHVRATSQADAGVTGVATVTVLPPGAVTVAVAPTTATVNSGATRQFTATVANSANTAVTWSLQEGAACGGVAVAGLYTAPVVLVATTCHVVATSVADGTAHGSATVTVSPVVVAVAPATASVVSGATRQFTATVTGAASTAVTWSVQEATGCGGVSAGGLYTAPTVAASTTCHVVATSTLATGARGTATVTVTPITIGVTVAPATATVQSGATWQFSATVTGTANTAVTWSLLEATGCGGVSGAGLYTAPGVTLSTTCHVIATSVADGSKSGSATVTVLPPGASRPNRLGVNVGAPLWWDATTVYADAMRQGVIENASALDANGWPLSASFRAVGAGDLRYANGTWTVYFDGTASVAGKTINGPGGTGPDGLPLGANTRWFTEVVTTTSNTDVLFDFTGAARNDGSGLAGLTNIKIMRPSTQGSSTSNRRDETIHRQVKALAQRFGTIRYMDFLAVNWSQITTWGGAPWRPGRAYAVGDRVTTCTSATNGGSPACGKVLQATVAGTSSATASAVPNPGTWNGTATDGTVTWRWVGWGRPLPTWSGFDRSEGNCTGSSAAAGGQFCWQGIGGPYEDVIKFANESGTDAWITIPAQVDDDYLVKVAQLFAFGSDGAMPYTSPQANPVFPPLAAGRNLYIELSNEIWLAGFSQSGYVDTQAAAAGLLQYQWVGRRVAQISHAFRNAFGDAEMPHTGSGRIRPVIMGQGASQDQTVGHALKWIHEVLGDADGVDHAATRTAAGLPAAPHPIRWYLYGSGGAPYWFADGTTAAGLLNSMSAATQHSLYLTGMNRHAAIYGMPMLAYEGGPEMPQNATGTAGNNADRPTSPNMRDLMLTNHGNWSASGGDLFTYFTLSTDPRWCFVRDDGFRGNIYQDSPKLLAMDELRAGTAAPVTLTPSTFQVGRALPGTAPGGDFALAYGDQYYTRSADGSNPVLSASSAWNNSAAWIFLGSDTASRTVSASLTGGGTVRAFVDGVQLGTDKTASGTVTFGTLSLGPGLHGVLLQAVGGSSTVTSVSVL